MKTKLSKKILAAFLSALMVVTSLPVMAFATVDMSSDAAVQAVEDAMDAFETKVDAVGKMYHNMSAAYTAYVDCQKALDAYIYGGNTNALSGKAAALNTAVANMTEYDGSATVNYVTPTFSDSSASEMEAYNGVAYSQVIYAPQATEQTSNDDAHVGNAFHKTYYATNPILLYTGSNDVLRLPVMMSAQMEASSNGYSKDRYIWFAYPTSQQETIVETGRTSDPDDLFWELIGSWKGGNDGFSADWDWNWWAKTTGQSGSWETGYKYGTSLQSQKIPKCNRSGNFWNYKYSVGNALYASNVLQLKSGQVPADYGQEYILFWSISTGGAQAGDTSVRQGSNIRVINYKTYTDAMVSAFNSLRSAGVANYKEGGMASLMTALDNATSFNLQTYATNGDYDGAVAQMKKLVKAVGQASNTPDSTSYAALRTAITSAIQNQIALGNTGYTTESWTPFESTYTSVKTIMANVLSNGYTYVQKKTDVSALNKTYAEALTYYYENLVTNISYQDTSALVSAIDTFRAYDKSLFTQASYASVTSAVNDIIASVWGSVDNYGVTTAGPVESDAAATQIAQAVEDVNTATRALRVNPAAKVAGNGFTMSLNDALALSVANPDDYSNYGTFATAQADGEEYVITMANTPFTNYATQRAAYVAMIQSIYDAYTGLQGAFTTIPDGTATFTGDSTSVTVLDRTFNSDRHYLNLTMSYPSSGAIIRMDHSATQATYGNVGFSFTVDNNGDAVKNNNSIDSIALNPSYSTNEKIGESTATSTPPAISDAQTNYPGKLYDSTLGFGMRNFSMVGANGYTSRYATDDSGNEVYDSTYNGFDAILGNTNGVSNDPPHGCVFAKPLVSGNPATINLQGEMYVDIPSTTAISDFNNVTYNNTKPTSSTLTLQNVNLGAVYCYNTQPVLAYAGYASVVSGDSLYSQVTVVDASNLVDLINASKAIANNPAESVKYSTESMTALNTALASANEYINYNQISTSTLLTRIQSKYKTLLEAYQALEYKTFEIGFTYQNATTGPEGATESVTVTYGETLNKYKTQIQTIMNKTAQTYEYGDYIYTFSAWDAVDYSAPVVRAATYVATYTRELGYANWTAYNNAKASLEGLLADETYLVTQLEAVNTLISGDDYYYYTDAQKAATRAYDQALIDANATALSNMASTLSANQIHYSEDQRTNAEYVASLINYDKDAYTVDFNYKEDVAVGNDSYVGLVYDAASLDSAIANALNGKATQTYTVYLNGTAVAESVPYGTAIKVNGDGTYQLNVDPTEKAEGDTSYSWTYSFSAPSTNGEQTAAKYFATAPAISFYVRGNTYLTSTSTEATETNTVVVRFIANLGGTTEKVLGVSYIDESEESETVGRILNMIEAPNYACYSYSGLSATLNGEDVTDDSSVFEKIGNDYYAYDNITIVYNYDVDTTQEQTYAVNLYLFGDNETIYNDHDMLVDAFGEVDERIKTDFLYNEKVELGLLMVPELLDMEVYAYCEIDDPAVLIDDPIDPTAFKVVHYGTDYSFYANENINLVALTADEYESVFGSSAEPQASVYARDGVVPVYDKNGAVEKFTLVGNFTLPEGCTAIEYGFLFSANTSADLTIENVGKNGVARMKSTRLTVGDQFTVNVMNPARSVEFAYAAYVIYEDAAGVAHTVTTDAVIGSNNFS